MAHHRCGDRGTYNRRELLPDAPVSLVTLDLILKRGPVNILFLKPNIQIQHIMIFYEKCFRYMRNIPLLHVYTKSFALIRESFALVRDSYAFSRESYVFILEKYFFFSTKMSPIGFRRYASIWCPCLYTTKSACSQAKE